MLFFDFFGRSIKILLNTFFDVLLDGFKNIHINESKIKKNENFI